MEKTDISSILIEKAKYYMIKKEEMQKALDSIRFVMKVLNEEPSKQKEKDEKFNARANFFVIPSTRIYYQDAVKMIFEKYPISIISADHIMANLRYLKETTFLKDNEIITINALKYFLNSLVKQNILELVNEFDDIHEPLYRLKKKDDKEVIKQSRPYIPDKKIGITEAIRLYFKDLDIKVTKLDILNYLKFLYEKNLLRTRNKNLSNAIWQTLCNLCNNNFLNRTYKTPENNTIYYEKAKDDKKIIKKDIIVENPLNRRMGITEAIRLYFKDHDMPLTKFDILGYLKFLYEKNLLRTRNFYFNRSLPQILKNLCQSNFLKQTSKNNTVYYEKAKNNNQ